MGILVDGLPKAILIDDKDYKINADYQSAIRIINAFEDKNLLDQEKAYILIELLYKEQPHNIEMAVKKGIQFLDCGDANNNEGGGQNEGRRYSFKHDEKYIFAGVNKVLNSRLSKGEFVHWWEFVMAFMELPEDCLMSRIIYFRTQYAKGKLSREEKLLYVKNKSIFQLPEELDNEEEALKDKFMEKIIGKTPVE